MERVESGGFSTLRLIVVHESATKEVRVYIRKTEDDSGDGICRADGALIWEGAVTPVEVWFKVGSDEPILGELKLLSTVSTC